ncbi:helix-turn-helix domain-containing protein [Dehalobacter sp. TeCB1]|uniref:helix-turn-helix domain-containing protein n=1 Tax=Dehalobacter sp. TeCB1 TaxID=1843715 RepID=UPI00083B6C3B|nr:helix-turn-helix domain-containing protein [Dehalobacter sp. TeCB1]OCZ51350.1 hypothetical protein A7D23_13080 [Dehalobacter sp. TeCB1]
MKGLTVVILSDLKQGKPVEEISNKFNLSLQAVYKLAKQYNIKTSPRLLSADEKKANKKQTDAQYYLKKRKLRQELDYLYERPDIPMPDLPPVACKNSGLGACNLSWVFSQENKKSSAKEHKETQHKYGLKTPR